MWRWLSNSISNSWVSAMQLVSNGSHKESNLDSEPILLESNTVQRSQEPSSSCEIGSVGDDFSEPDCDQNCDADEYSNLVTVEQPQCRICLDSGGEDLIAPCHCKGTQKYVHRSCLDSWRSTREGFAFAHCTECRAVFILRANVPSDRWWLRLRFQLLVARDHVFIFVIVQLTDYSVLGLTSIQILWGGTAGNVWFWRTSIWILYDGWYVPFYPSIDVTTFLEVENTQRSIYYYYVMLSLMRIYSFKEIVSGEIKGGRENWGAREPSCNGFKCFSWKDERFETVVSFSYLVIEVLSWLYPYKA